MKPALLVIDVQKEFFKMGPETARSLDSAIEYINAAIDLFRARGLPVISVQDKDVEAGCVPGAGGFDLPDSLKVLPSDLHIVKTYGNAFNKTPLADALRTAGVDTVIVTGFCAEYCVLSTYVGARDHDLTPILLRNAIASGRPESVRFVENAYDVISYGALKKMLQ
ncbi:MAG: nicotinamidase/pyrazinamidase [Methanocella sp. PtaU1.Bin125]|nr:MAG: nicotinamidase/pyrazinamidase [Methanocella sp. PtaU1.Bin125]